MENYLLVIGKTASGYSGHCPAVLGCAAVGKTVEEVRENMKEALTLHFEGMREDGDPIPEAGGINAYQEVFDDLESNEDFLTHVQIDASRFATPASQS